MSIAIKSAEPYILRVPIGETIADSFNVADEVELPGVSLTLEDGTKANGYTMTLGAGGDAIHSHLTQLANLTVGRSPLESEQLWSEMFWSDLHWVGRAGTVAMAQSAVDVALWDARAKIEARPLWQLLARSGPEPLPAYNTHVGWLNIPTDNLVSNAKAAGDEGFIGVKVKLGKQDPKDDLDRVAKVRAAVGDAMRLMTDVNQRWDLETAVTVGNLLALDGVFWLEEPMAPDSVLAHERLASQISTPIALGEHLYNLEAFAEFIERGAVRFVQPDVTRAGGVTGFLRIAKLAETSDLPVCAHAGDLMQVHQHLSIALANIEMLEYLPWCTEIWQEPVRVENGIVKPPSEPGASTTFTQNAWEKYRVR